MNSYRKLLSFSLLYNVQGINYVLALFSRTLFRFLYKLSITIQSHHFDENTLSTKKGILFSTQHIVVHSDIIHLRTKKGSSFLIQIYGGISQIRYYRNTTFWNYFS